MKTSDAVATVRFAGEAIEHLEGALACLETLKSRAPHSTCANGMIGDVKAQIAALRADVREAVEVLDS